MQRFISEDPLGFAAGPNAYAYVENNPLRFRDPFGLDKAAAAARPNSCPALPPSSPGVSVDANMQAAALLSGGPPGLETWWFVGMVKNHGPWDYKRLDQKYIPFGNFNFGATGTALGYHEQIVLRGAGAYQYYRSFRGGAYNPKWGKPWGGPPYGDDPDDQADIRLGILYARCRGY